MAWVDENGREWLDLTDPEDQRRFDEQVLALGPSRPLSDYAGHRARRKAERKRKAVEVDETNIDE